MSDFVGAIDQGTTSTRFMVFDHSGAEVARHQLEHEQIMPRPGWVEHDPAADLGAHPRRRSRQALSTASLRTADLAALGLTNQRETTLVWNRRTGRPYGNAIVWQDTRTDRIAAGPGPGRPGRRDQAQGRPAPGHLLLRRQAAVDARPRRRPARRRRTRRGHLRHRRHLAAVEPHRRRQRRRARDRRHQRQPHHADGPGRPWTGTTSCSASSPCRGRCCRGSCPPRPPNPTG